MSCIYSLQVRFPDFVNKTSLYFVVLSSNKLKIIVFFKLGSVTDSFCSAVKYSNMARNRKFNEKRNNIRIKIALETSKIGTQTIPGVFFQFRVFCRYISYFEVPISYNRVMTFLKGIIKNAFIPVKT